MNGIRFNVPVCFCLGEALSKDKINTSIQLSLPSLPLHELTRYFLLIQNSRTQLSDTPTAFFFVPLVAVGTSYPSCPTDVTSTDDLLLITNCNGQSGQLTPKVLHLMSSYSPSQSANLSITHSPSQVTLPVYLTQTRSKLLFTADFKAEGANFYERGVAIICSSL